VLAVDGPAGADRSQGGVALAQRRVQCAGASRRRMDRCRALPRRRWRYVRRRRGCGRAGGRGLPHGNRW